MPEVSNVVYCDEASHRVNATISGVEGPDGALVDLRLEEVDISMDAPYPNLIRAWMEAGNAPVPKSVTPRQARLALLAVGLLDQVESSVKAAGGATQITWEYASTFERGDPLITSIGASLNLTPAQIDALFTQASKL
ncbi:hypothetical protein IVB46_09605 [Bradyrhizobium sp. 61]|uniref:hypothetical protein n=1 Tax=Bradyrhizobium sp. 61 TaxID=2782679 RepID=UPI001FFB5DD9|nr:hypothetical protein [Bradyrhizobium sp. 61]MCK1275483.1 hypothetical protein [Bradyrhizobium sp. 61]